jgi:hypothetical protein
MKRIKQGYGVRSYFKLMLNKLKVMGVSYFYLYPFVNLVQRSFHESFHVPPTMKIS